MCFMLCLQNITFMGVSTAEAGEPADVTSHFYATITTKDGGSEYVSGSTVTFLVKYKLDYGVINAGDYIYMTVPKALAVSRLSVDPTHFSSSAPDHTDNDGNQVYKLVFSDNAKTGISGSMTLRVTANNTGNSNIEPVLQVGSNTISITVIPGGPSDTGTETRAIEKDARGSGGKGMSDGWNSSEAGYSIYDPDKGAVAPYRIFVNLKQASLTDVTVTDYLPEGLTFGGKGTISYCWTATGQSNVDLTAAEQDQISFTQNGNQLIWTIGSLLENRKQLLIQYKAEVPAGPAVNYHNVAVINYTEEGVNKTESASRNIYPESNADASLGVKSVDKTEVSSDPADQFVEYTFTFRTHADSDNNMIPFEAGEINLTDKLDENVRFVRASYVDDNFSVAYDEGAHSVLIKNTKRITDGGTEHEVSFVVDFSEVPAGTTVSNTVGGNTVNTKKYGGGLNLQAAKTLDGKAPGTNVFQFQLIDSTGNILQTKKNDSDGNIIFDRISYAKNDIGKTFIYKVKEIAGQDPAIVYDATVYTVTVTPAEPKQDGNITAVPVFTDKDGNTVSSLSFGNKTAKTSVKVTKKWVGPVGTAATVRVMNGAAEAANYTLTAADNWTYTFTGLPKYDASGKEIVYTVTEDAVDNYDSAITGDIKNGFTVTNTSNVMVSIPVTKKWVGPVGAAATVRVMNGAAEAANYTLTAADNWTYTFTGLPKYDASGKEIVYTVTEDAVSNYDSAITGDIKNGFTVTNTITEKIVSISKTDVGGMEIPDAVLTVTDLKTGNTAAEFTTDGKSAHELMLPPGMYRLTEITAPDGYEKAESIDFRVDADGKVSVNGADVNGTVTMVDQYIPETARRVSVHKTWRGYGARPASVTFRLYVQFSDGTEKTVGDDKQAKASNNWTAEWTKQEIASASDASPSDASPANASLSDAEENGVLKDGMVGNRTASQPVRKITGFYVKEINVPKNWKVVYYTPVTSADADGTEATVFPVKNVYVPTEDNTPPGGGGGSGSGTATSVHSFVKTEEITPTEIPLQDVPGLGVEVFPEIEIPEGMLPKTGEEENTRGLLVLLAGILAGVGLLVKHCFDMTK